MQIGLFSGSFTQYADLFTIFRFFSLASVNNAPTHSAEKKLHGEKFDWPFREVAIEKAFQIPIKSTVKEKEAVTAEFIENIVSACLSFKRDQNR